MNIEAENNQIRGKIKEIRSLLVNWGVKMHKFRTNDQKEKVI